MKRIFLFFLLIFMVIFLLHTNQSFAYVIASSDMSLYNLTFSSSDSSAELLWIDDWYAEVIAHAQDGCSGSSDDYADLLGNDGWISAAANTTHVNSDAYYSVITGDLVAIDSDSSIEASTHSDINIPDAHICQGDGDAITNFDNFFIIIGGTPGDPVDVQFTLDYLGQLTGDADELGYFSVALGALFQLYDVSGNLLGSDAVYDIHSGTNTYFHQDYRGDYSGSNLTLSKTLLYESEYWLYAEADSEVYGANLPEPSTFLLLLFGAPLIIKNIYRTKRDK